MTEAEALARLTAMTAASSEPTLSAEELAILLEDNRVADEYGRGPAQSGYIDTWNLRAAAAEGWRWKAGKVAELYSFRSDVHSYQRAEHHKHCLEMIKLYQGGAAGSIELARRPAYDPVIGNLNGGT